MSKQSETFGELSALIRQAIESLLQRGCRNKYPCRMAKSNTEDECIVKSKPNRFLPAAILLVALMLAMAIDSRDSEARALHSSMTSAGVPLKQPSASAVPGDDDPAR